MRRALCAVFVLFAAGCGVGTSASLTAHDATSALAAKNHGLSGLATTELAAIMQQAQTYSTAHGSMAGFADDLRTNQPSVASTALVLTDSSASVSAGAGSCLTATLPAGDIETVTC